MTSTKSSDIEASLSSIRLRIIAQNAKRIEVKKSLSAIEDTIVSLKEEEGGE